MYPVYNYSIIFTQGGEQTFLSYSSQKDANKKFKELKKQVDELSKMRIYSSVTMNSSSIYGDNEISYDNLDKI
jgi:galactose-1-phosphate uridylyltransferase